MTHSLTLRIAARRPITESIVLLDLETADGTALPTFTAGAHLRLELPNDLTRAYSICNDPKQLDRYQLAVQLEAASRGGSRWVHENLHPGATVEANGPHNLFELDESAPYSVLLGGGIGITPLMAMAHRLQNRGLRWEMHYSTRSPQHCAFRNQLAQGPLSAHTRLYHDTNEPHRRLNLQQLLSKAPAGAHLYVCGPAGLIDAALAIASGQGWSSERLHCERFAAAPQAASSPQARPFTVVLARSGLSLQVPADQSVLSVIRKAGIHLPSACEEGICGTCITDVLEGSPEHRDQCLDESLRSSCFTPCCSRSLDDTLTIDL